MTNKGKSETPSASGILAGVRVVEFGHYIAAPLMGVLLAEQGAEVIHVVPPDRDTAYPILDAILERGKTQVKLNLNDDIDRIRFIRLIEKADIFIDNYSPWTLKKFDIDLAEVRHNHNPGLISCKVWPFPSWDKRNKRVPGYESIVAMEGFIYERVLKSPYYHTFPIGSILSALYGACAVMASLYKRIDSKRGQHIDVNLYESNIFAQILQILVFNGAPRSFAPLKMVGSPFMGVWECKNGRYIYLHVTIPAHNAGILDLIKHSGHEKEIVQLEQVMSEETKQDPTMVASLSEAKKIKAIMKRIYLSKDAEEWEEILGKDYCCIKIRNLKEWIEESLTSHNQDCMEIDDPIFGKLFTPGAAAIAADTDPVYNTRKIGECDVDALIRQWDKDYSYSSFENGVRANEEPSSPPLEGVKVFDMSRVIAGPFSARILAELGAEVVTIQRPKNLGWALSFHVIFNMGKESVTLDFATEEGKQILFEFLKDYSPHVFLQNFRSLDFSKEIGMDYESIEKILPGIVYSYVNADGIEGEWQTRPAFEQVVQAVSGIQMEYVQGGRPKLFPFAILDMGAGLLSAFSSLLGLYNQKTKGKGGFCHAHMTSMAMLLQIMGFERIQREKIEGILHRTDLPFTYSPEKTIQTKIFRGLGRYLCLSGPEEEILRWRDGENLIKDPEKPFNGKIQDVKRWRWTPGRYLQRKIRKNGFEHVGLAKHRQIIGFVKRYRKKDKADFPLISMKEYPGLTKLPFIRIPIEFSHTPLVDVKPSPKIGQDSRKHLEKYLNPFQEEDHILEYPEEQPLFEYLANLVVWGVYAVRSGNI